MINRDRSRRKKKGSNILLLVLLVLLLAFLFSNYFPNARNNKSEGAGLTEIVAPVNLNKKFDLPDRASGVLNDGSSITYDADQKIGMLSVDLIGESHFKVKKNQVIIVNTAHGEINAIAANVNIRAWGKNLYVECYEGSLTLKLKNKLTTIGAGESINVVDGVVNDIVKIRGEEPLWIGGIMRFYDVSMQEVYDELERQFDATVTAAPDDRRFSGSFIHFNLRKALEQICTPMDLKFEVQEGRKIVIEKI